MSDEVYIKKIRLTNCRNIREAEINFGRKEPGEGQIVELVGDNQQGKTTIRDMVLKIFEGGKDPGLVRNGAEVAEGTIVLSDGHVITRTHSRTESTLNIVGPSGVKVEGGPATYLKRFGSWFARDPVAFDEGRYPGATSEADARIKILLEISDVVFEPAEIETAIGPVVAKLIPPPDDAIPLQALKKDQLDIGKFLKRVTEHRAQVGNQRDEKTNSIEALRKTLPVDDSETAPKDWAAELRQIETKIAAIDKEERDGLETIKSTVSLKRGAINAECRKSEDAIQAEFQALMLRARGGRPEEIGDTLEVALVDLAGKYVRLRTLNEGEEEALEAAKKRASEAREALAGDRATAQAAATEQIKAGAVRDSIATFQAAATKLTATYDALVTAAKNLEKLRKSKVDGALIEGMDVKDDIYMNGIKWPDINTADRLFYSMQLCTRGAGDAWCGFFVIDGGERFGPKRKKEIAYAVVASGEQAIMCTVASPEWIKANGPDIMSVPAGVLKVKK